MKRLTGLLALAASAFAFADEPAGRHPVIAVDGGATVI